MTFHPLLAKIGKIIGDPPLFRAGERWLVAVSGGPDSMALLHLLVEQAGLDLVVACLDHGLRPEEAAAEVALVARAAAGLGLPFETGRLPVREEAKRLGLSLEHAARDLRYSFLRDLAARYGAAKIAVGHTADDQAEEILLRLIRGSGRAGLSGMSLSRNGIVRPLLTTSKADLLDYLAKRQIPFLIDSSNRERVHLRNRVRLDLLPALAADFNPNIAATLRRTAEVLGAEEELLADLSDAAYALCVEEEGADPPVLSIGCRVLADQPLALRRRVLEMACWRLGCRPSCGRIEQLMALALESPGGSRLHLSRGLRALKRNGRVCLQYPQGRGAFRGDLAAPVFLTAQNDKLS